MARIRGTSKVDTAMDDVHGGKSTVALVRKADAKYIDGGTWKCGDSPSGAHHWIRVTYDKMVDALWHCKWCDDFRVM